MKMISTSEVRKSLMVAVALTFERTNLIQKSNESLCIDERLDFD